MRILVYPHSMELGGSQLNAIEIGAAVRDLGHDVVIYSEPGPLTDRVAELGLEHVLRKESAIRPGLSTAAHVRHLAVDCGFDVLHGYEWPPILECHAAGQLSRGRSVAVGTVMSMGVAPFIPSSIPLMVGTQRIQAHAAARRHGPVELMEPPVDTTANSRFATVEVPAGIEGLDPDARRVVLVCRLAPELKLEGVLTTMRAVGVLARSRSVQCVVVGDGPAADQVARVADEVNRGLDVPAVILAGEWADPRWAYASADICVGMGGSALRAMAFSQPLVVQGEGGFFDLLTPESAPRFLHQGWYGQADLGAEEAVDRLVGLLGALLDDPVRRAELGDYARRLVDARFSLTAAAVLQVRVYQEALAATVSVRRRLTDLATSGAGLVRYKVDRRVDRLRGRFAVDDFNAKPV